MPNQNIREEVAKREGLKNYTSIKEIYNLSRDLDSQLRQRVARVLEIGQADGADFGQPRRRQSAISFRTAAPRRTSARRAIDRQAEGL